MSEKIYVKRINTSNGTGQGVGTIAEVIKFTECSGDRGAAILTKDGQYRWWNRNNYIIMPEGWTPEGEMTETEKLSEIIHAMKEHDTANGNGLRYNSGKLRLDLIPPEVDEGLAEVLTFGANKYSDRNWEKGMKMMPIVASLKRHLLKWEKGEDKDDESGLSHLKHVLTNAAFLVTMEARMPEMDDRPCKQ